MRLPPLPRLAPLVATLLVSRAAAGQGAGPTLRGVAFDSLRGRPLAGAFVTLDERRSVETDTRGRFAFDAVAPGAHALAVQHAVLDSAGLSGIAARVTVTDGRDEVAVATPSFATFWRGVCGPGSAPPDSGFVYGTVSDAGAGRPLAGAVVDLRFMQLAAQERQGAVDVTQRPWRGATRTSTAGVYAICGVPVGVALRIQAATDSAASGLIDLPPDDFRVRRRDLVVGLVGDSAGDARGVVVGTVTNEAGVPFPGARVLTDDVAETRTDSAGRFVLRRVPTGTRQLEVLAVGTSPVVETVDVRAGDTTTVATRLRRLSALDVVRVTASRRVRQIVGGVEARRRGSFGYVRDSTAFATRSSMASMFEDFPGARVQRGRTASDFTVNMPAPNGGRCTAGVWIDGYRADFEMLATYQPDQIAITEVYPQRMNTPLEFASARTNCGVVVVWTKFALK